MDKLDNATLITLVTVIVSGISILLGTIIPTLMEGKVAIKALESMARQPDAAPQLRTTMIIAMALIETASIYVLLIILVLLFANPLVERVFGG